jgi:hypothetical protein
MAPPYTAKQADTYNPQVRDTGCNDDTLCGDGDNRNCDYSIEEAWDSGYRCGDCNDSSGINCLKYAKLSAGGSRYCPPGVTGTVSRIDYANHAHQLVCTYSSVTTPLNQLSTYFDTATVARISDDRCGAKDFDGLMASSECQAFYGRNLNYELLKRLEQTDKQWAFNASARTFINQVIKEEPTVTSVTSTNSPAADKSTAIRLVQELCDAYPGGVAGNEDLCSCYNTVKYGPQGCNNSYPGCRTLNDANAALQALNATVQITGASDHFCASSNCQDARNGSNSSSVLLKDTPHTCSINSLVCIQDFTRANFNNSSLTSSCRNELFRAAPSPGTPPPPGTPPGAQPPSGTPGTPPGTPAPSPTQNKKPLIIGALVVLLIVILLIVVLAVQDEN